jgi:hypothetical protein
LTTSTVAGDDILEQLRGLEEVYSVRKIEL